jgi:hypothetical protein
LYNAYPEGALQKNNDNNTPLDLAIADGASPNVVLLLQGKSVPPMDDEVLEAAKCRCERMEKELQKGMEQHDGMSEDRELVLTMLMDIHDNHPHAINAAGINPNAVNDIDSLLEQVRLVTVTLYYALCFTHIDTHSRTLRRFARQPWKKHRHPISVTKKLKLRLSKIRSVLPTTRLKSRFPESLDWKLSRTISEGCVGLLRVVLHWATACRLH